MSREKIRNAESEIPASVARRAKAIRLLVLDVDGILTDGQLLYGPRGQAQMAFHVHDGQGIKLARDGGLSVAILTGRRSAMVARRARELGITELHQKVEDKLAAFRALLERQGLRPAQAACMGDDLTDLRILRRAGLAITVPGAVAEIRAAAHYVTHRGGGQGAVREAVELVLKAQGRWAKVLEDYR